MTDEHTINWKDICTDREYTIESEVTPQLVSMEHIDEQTEGQTDREKEKTDIKLDRKIDK